MKRYFSNPAKRKLTISLICLLCALLLIGCGNAAPAESGAPSPAAEAPEESAVPAATLPDENLEPAGEPTPYEIALDYIDRPLEDLIAVIGEPLFSDYGPSCFSESSDAQDGNLQFDGFWVWTLKDGDLETVKGVYLGSYKDVD